MPKKKNINPFYVLLLLAGSAFAITALAFGVMTVRSLHASRSAGYGPIETGEKSLIAATSSFDGIVDRYGTKVMIGELILLAVGTFGAIAYDQHLDRKQAAAKPRNSKQEDTP